MVCRDRIQGVAEARPIRTGRLRRRHTSSPCGKPAISAMYAHFDAWSEPGLAAAPSSGPVFDSPSLQTRKVGESAAFERKFVLDEAVARALERALSNHLRPDPNAAAR